MVMIGLAIIAAGGLALTAFILFSVMGVGGRDRVAARSAGNGSGGAPNGALERQRAIEEKIDSARAATVKAKEQSGAGQKDSAKGDFQRGPEEKNPDVVPDPGPGAARVLDASDTRSISGSAGKTVTISGRVSSCTWSSSGKVLFVNFSSDRSSFYAVMFKNREKDFLDEFGSPPDKRLAGRSVEITGRVEMYEGRPQIKLEKPGQVKFVD